jgi:putative transposase
VEPFSGSRRPPGDGFPFLLLPLVCDLYHAAVMLRTRKRLDHQTPDWVQEASVYFVTVCAIPRQANHFCHAQLGPTILESIAYRHQNGTWFCDLAVLMPDHVHFLLSFPDVPAFSKIVGEWKRWLTTHHAISWQENFFEHRLRNDENFNQKADYILQNPVRAGLISDAKDWPYVWMPRED